MTVHRTKRKHKARREDPEFPVWGSLQDYSETGPLLPLGRAEQPLAPLLPATTFTQGL